MANASAKTFAAQSPAAAAGQARPGGRRRTALRRRYLVRSPHPLPPHPQKMTERLDALGRSGAGAHFPGAARRRGGWRTVTYARNAGTRCARSRAALLERGCRPTGRVAILSGNDIEHALLGARRHACRHSLRADLAAVFADVVRFRQAHAIMLAAVRPALVFAASGTAFARAIAARRAGRRRGRRHGAVAGRPARDAFARLARRPRRRRRSTRACRGRPRHRRQDPVHLRLDRHAQGRDQHAAHAVRQPADDPRRACLSRRRAAGDGRLVAVESHLRQQPQFQHGALQRRLALHRRGQAAARAIDATVRNLRDVAPTIYFNVPKGFEMLCHISPRSRLCARPSSAASR